MREQRVSGVPSPFSSLQSLPPAFMMRSKPSAYYLIVVANSSSSSSAGKCQPDRLLVRKRDERRESNESSSLFHTTCGQPKPHSEAHRDTIGAWQPDRTACYAWTGEGWKAEVMGQRYERTTVTWVAAPCTAHTSCSRCAPSTNSGSPPPQHHSSTPQKAVSRFHRQFSSSRPRSVIWPPLPVVWLQPPK